ncbi:alpha/beta-hydrolase [Apiospora rasikravindrae]|uniref:Alpha/beta-hydrolase n=1 Tax=Apiospora rasikravindrae TaxID=990691 RepID=A0ABR1RXW6_9PEZI
MHYFSFAVPLWGLAAFATASGSSCCKAAGKCPVTDVSALRSTGDPVGNTTVFENVTMYYTGQEDKCRQDTAVLFLTDIYGLASPEDLRLADSFGRAGYFTVAPDLFDGAPSPLDMNAPGFNQTQFLAAHGPDVTDPLVAKGIRYLREVRGYPRVAVTGYCFGGRTRGRRRVRGAPGHVDGRRGRGHYAAGLGRARPARRAEPPARRQEMENLFDNLTTPWQVDLYSGAMHGFAVRGNLSDPQMRFAKETAFIQAVRWFQFWAK